MEQLSQEWFDARKGKITASNVGAILGLSPYKSRDDVMRDMVREHFGAEKEFDGNIATAYGQQLEPVAVSAYEARLGVFVEETGFHLHPDIDWLGASPDGIAHNGKGSRLIEIKCPYSRKPFSLEDRQDYEAQVQIQLQCTKFDTADFVVWTPEEMTLTPVERDDDWFNTALPVLKDFYNEYLSIIADEEKAAPHLEPKEVERNDDEWMRAATLYRMALDRLGEAKEYVSEAKEALLTLAGGTKTKGSGVLVYPVKGRTTTDYQKIVKDNCPDVDMTAYQKTGKESWSIRVEQ